MYRQSLNYLCETLNQNKIPAEYEQSLDFLYSSLCYFPFWEWRFDESDSIQIPQFIDNKWQMVEFTISCIELTPKKGFLSLWIQEKDQSHAYGLSSKQKDISPILIFSGTTYPAGDGCLTHIKNDFKAFRSVGDELFQSGKTQIQNWIKDLNGKKTKILGMSLGGGVALIMATKMPQAVEEVFAFNPPGLYHLPQETTFTQPPVRVLSQLNDPVSKLGKWHANWTLAHIHLPTDIIPNQLIAHASIYAGRANKTYEYLVPYEKNTKHNLLNFYIFKILRTFTYFTFILPMYYLIIPLIRFAWYEKWHLLTSLAFIFAGLSLFSSLGLGIICGELINWKNSSIFNAYKTMHAENNKALIINISLILSNIITVFCASYLLPITLHASFLLIPLIDKLLKTNTDSAESNNDPGITP